MGELSLNLVVSLVILSVLIFLGIFKLIRERKLPIKYSLFWIASGFVILIVSLIPGFVGFFTKLIGFETTSNFVTGILFIVLLAITLLLTIISSKLKSKVVTLTQEVSLLKERVERLEKK